MEEFNNINDGQDNQKTGPENQNPTFNNPVNPDPGYQNQGYQNTGYQNPGYQNPGYQNPNFQNPNFRNPNLQTPPINPGALYSLRLSGWATFMGIIYIIAGSLSAIFALMAIASASHLPIAGGPVAVIIIIFYIPLSILMILSGAKLISAVDETKKFQQSGDISRLAFAFNKLNQSFAFCGIIAIISLVFMLIVIIITSSAAPYLSNPFEY